MGRIILSEILNDIRNRVGENVYYVDKGLHYVRTGPRTIANPDTEKQGTFRDCWLDANARWYGNLSDSQRAKWETYAKSFGSARDNENMQGKLQLIRLNRKRMCGFNAYVMVQILRRSIGLLDWNDDAPLGVAKPTEPKNLVLTYNPDPANTFSLTWDDPIRLGANGKIRVWARNWCWAHTQIVSVVFPDVENITWGNMTGRLGIVGPLQPGKYDVQLDGITEEGVKGANSVIKMKVI
jgi:hypothetical protein